MPTANKKLVIGSIALSLLCILGFQIPAPAEWQRPIQPSLSGGALTCLASHPLDVSKFLIASGQQVFEAGKENAWQPLWSQSDTGAPIKRLFSFGVLPEIIFAITDRNVFMGNLKDRSWREVYKDSGKAPLAFAVHPQDPNRWFLETQKGLRETADAGKTWSASRALHGSSPVPLVFLREIASSSRLKIPFFFRRAARRPNRSLPSLKLRANPWRRQATTRPATLLLIFSKSTTYSP